jgi:hypothetical protein
MKDLLFQLFIGATLIAVGMMGGYFLSQWVVLERFDEVLNTEQLYYEASDLQYIAIGDTLTTKQD